MLRAVEIARELAKREEERYPALLYARRYHLNTRGQPMSFTDRPYLLALYKALPRPDQIPEGGIDIVLQKCVQMGASEWAICAVLSYAGEYGRAIMYVLPKFDLKYTFTSNRIDKPINRIPYYAAKLREVHRGAKTKALKDFGRGVIKVVGSNVETEFVEFPADVVIVDEADQCDQNLIPIARDRLKGPGSLRIHVKLGNPTIETGGLHADFIKSNRMEWYVPCPHCGMEQEVRFFGNVMRPPPVLQGQKQDISKSQDWALWELIDREWHEKCGRDIRAYCRGCGKPMDRLAMGRWWEENPGARVIGFHLSKTMDPTYPLSKLFETFDKARHSETAMQLFFNYDLGIPYTSYNAQLNRDIIRACMGDHRQLEAVPPDVRCVMGIDVGTVLHYWIEELIGPKGIDNTRRRVVKIGFCKEFAELHRLMITHNVASCVIDARPESRESKRFVDAYRRGRAWRCDYEYHGLKMPSRDWQERLLKADRTISMDNSHGQFVARMIVLPTDIMSAYNGHIVEQLCSSVRVKEVRPNGSEAYVWDPKDRADHWRHACNYAYMAQTLYSPPTTGVKV
jgi:hypothetical protein